MLTIVIPETTLQPHKQAGPIMKVRQFTRDSMHIRSIMELKILCESLGEVIFNFYVRLYTPYTVLLLLLEGWGVIATHDLLLVIIYKIYYITTITILLER